MHAQPMQRVDLKALCEDILQRHLDDATAKHIDLGSAGLFELGVDASSAKLFLQLDQCVSYGRQALSRWDEERRVRGPSLPRRG